MILRLNEKSLTMEIPEIPCNDKGTVIMGKIPYEYSRHVFSIK